MPASSPPRRRTLWVICLFWLTVMLILRLGSESFRAAERIAEDWLITGPGARLPEISRDLVFLKIDEAAQNLEAVPEAERTGSRALELMREPFPWSREVYALAIEKLRRAGARLIIFDLLFPGPRTGDRELRSALLSSAGHVVFGLNLQPVTEDADAAQTTLSHKPALILPTPELRPPTDAPSLLGFVNVHADDDGLVRRVVYRSTLLDFFGIPAPENTEDLFSLAGRGLVIQGLASKLPAGREPVRIRFSDGFFARSLHEIFVEKQWAAPPFDHGKFFRDKIIVIGAAGVETNDRLRTPSGVLVGALLHLSALNAALTQDFLRESGFSADVLFSVGAAFLAWIFGQEIRRPLLRLALLLLMLALLYTALQFSANSLNYLPPVLAPLGTLAFAGFTWSVWEQALDHRERQRVRGLLERYVSRDIVRELVDKPDSVLHMMGGERREVVVLFSDIRGFTTHTEGADPRQLVEQLNEYFEEMVQIVFSHRGTLDKFIGDSVMAHWGSIASAGATQDAASAVRTALEMTAAVERLNVRWQIRGWAPFRIGIGINRGLAVVGNLGSPQKSEITVIGDSVNLASRLEGTTKQYSLSLCIGESVADLVRESFEVLPVDEVLVRGKAARVKIFTVSRERTENPDAL